MNLSGASLIRFSLSFHLFFLCIFFHFSFFSLLSFCQILIQFFRSFISEWIKFLLDIDKKVSCVRWNARNSNDYIELYSCCRSTCNTTRYHKLVIFFGFFLSHAFLDCSIMYGDHTHTYIHKHINPLHFLLLSFSLPFSICVFFFFAQNSRAQQFKFNQLFGFASLFRFYSLLLRHQFKTFDIFEWENRCFYNAMALNFSFFSFFFFPFPNVSLGFHHGFLNEWPGFCKAVE